MKFLWAISFAIASFFFLNPAFAQFDCTSKAFAEHIDDTKFNCKETQVGTMPEFGGITLRTLIDKNDFTADIAQADVTEKVKSALKIMAAMPAGLSLKIDDVAIVLLRKDAKSPGDSTKGQVLGIATKYENECVLALYPSRIVGNPKSIANELSFVVAHELFHCVQHATWPELLANHTQHAWVIEGTAETVAQAVFPNIPEAFSQNFNFANKFRDTPRTQLTYPNLVFFSWVWNQSPEKMFQILSAMPPKADEAGQQKALLTVVSASDLSQFVRDYLDGKIHTPKSADSASGKTPLQMVTNIGLAQFDRSMSRDLIGQPFVMFAVDAQFSGGKYNVSFENIGEIDWRHRQMRPRAGSEDFDPDGEWASGNLITQSDCATPDRFRFAGMSTGQAKLRVKAELDDGGDGDCKSCGATAARDQCLVGTWRIDNARMGLSLSQYLAGDRAVGAAVAGMNAIKFDKDGQSVWGYQNFKISVQENQPGTPITSAVLSGTIDQGWSASRGRLNTCFISADAKIQIQIGRKRGQAVDFNGLPRQSTETYSYDCQPDGSLLIEQKIDGKPFLMRLHKLD